MNTSLIRKYWPFGAIALLLLIVIVQLITRKEKLPDDRQARVDTLQTVVDNAAEVRMENLAVVESLRAVTAERQKEINRLRGSNEQIRKDLELSLRVINYVSPDSLYADLNSIARDLQSASKASGPVPQIR
jgi:hypothetical protein